MVVKTPHRKASLVVAAWVISLSVTVPAFGTVHENFESGTTTWRVRERDCPLRLEDHRRTFDAAHSGKGSEYLRYWTGPGTQLMLVHDLSRPRVIDELVPSVWMKAPRSGMQLSVRAVLPRSLDPQTGAPMTVLLTGDSYETPGGWRQLRVTSLPQKLEQQVRILRTRFGPQVSAAEAYIDLMVVNAYAGSGECELWLDDLEIAGYASAGDSQSYVSLNERQPTTPNGAAISAGSPRGRSTVEVAADLVMANATPIFVRGVYWRGEPFDVLADLGINTVILDSPVTDHERNAARAHGLWLVAPPPRDPAELADDSKWTQILAWNTGQRLTGVDREAFARQAAQIRAGSSSRRLVMADIDQDVGQLSGDADILLMHRAPIATSLDLGRSLDYWRVQSRLAGGVKPYWAGIQTQLSEAQVDQLNGLGQEMVTSQVDADQVWLQVGHAIAAGARGIVYTTATRLDKQSSNEHAWAVERCNRLLTLIEPWIAAGRAGTPQPAQQPSWTSVTLENDRSRLLVVLNQHSHQQYVIRDISLPSPLRVPAAGRRVTDRVYRVGSNGIEPIRDSQSTLSGEVAISEPDVVTLALLTDDPVVVNHIGQRSAQSRGRLAELELSIARQQLDTAIATLAAMPPKIVAATQADRLLQPLDRVLRRAVQMGEAGDVNGMQQQTRSVRMQLRRVRYALWQQAALEFPATIASPLCTSFAALPQHWKLAARLGARSWGVNQIAGGNFEDLEHLLTSGWRQHLGHPRYVDARTELSFDAPRNGRSSLKLLAWPQHAEVRHVDSWPAWISSSPIPVQAGKMYRIHGWVHIPEPLTGDEDGLLIFDSLTGLDFAHRVVQTRGWQEFTLYRHAPSDGEMTIVIALTGIGAAFADDLEVRFLE